MKMPIAAVLVSLATGSTAYADPLVAYEPGLLMERAVKKEHRGRGLTIAAIVQLTVGTALLVAPTLEHAQGTFAAGQLVAGTFATLSGGIEALVGIPTWVVGARDEKRIQTSISASAGGVRLTF